MPDLKLPEYTFVYGTLMQGGWLYNPYIERHPGNQFVGRGATLSKWNMRTYCEVPVIFPVPNQITDPGYWVRGEVYKLVPISLQAIHHLEVRAGYVPYRTKVQLHEDDGTNHTVEALLWADAHPLSDDDPIMSERCMNYHDDGSVSYVPPKWKVYP